MRNTFMYNLAAVLALCALLSSCCAPKEAATKKETASKQEAASKKGTLTIEGTMKYLDVEGGCWQFAADDGTKYEVIGDGVENLRHDGVKATIVVRSETSGMMSTCMVGKIVELVEIIKLTKE